mgnify:CR=1 FL=1
MTSWSTIFSFLSKILSLQPHSCILVTTNNELLLLSGSQVQVTSNVWLNSCFHSMDFIEIKCILMKDSLCPFCRRKSSVTISIHQTVFSLTLADACRLSYLGHSQSAIKTLWVLIVVHHSCGRVQLHNNDSILKAMHVYFQCWGAEFYQFICSAE